ncbi:hypothetical protein KJ891_04890 [Candidatus Micrarchaeota archaeon]|nr:hypothetical protein [Candidatus Micrarchaeota archaeon]
MRTRLRIAIVLLIAITVLLSGCPQPDELIGGGDGNAGNGDEQPDTGNGNGDAGDGNGNGDAGNGIVPGEAGFTIQTCLAYKNPLDGDNCLIALAKGTKSGLPCAKLQRLSKDTCYEEVAIDALDYRVCQEMGVEVKRNRCLQKVGTKTASTDACSVISDRQMRDSCFDSVAYDNQNVQICLKVASTPIKDKCIYDLAKNSGNVRICAFISGSIEDNEYIRDNCYLEVAPNSTVICGKLVKEERAEECYIRLSNCENIKGAEDKANCYDNAARGSQDYMMCNQIDDEFEEIRAACVRDVINAYPTLDGCSLLPDETEGYQCYYDLGVAANNVEICNRIENKRAKRDDCIVEIAFNTNDHLLCDEIIKNDPAKRNYCYTEIAVTNLDIKICNYATTASHYINCYSDIAIVVDDPFICEDAVRNYPIEQYTSKNTCFYNVAIGELNVLFCDNITHSVFRERCHKELGD